MKGVRGGEEEEDERGEKREETGYRERWRREEKQMEKEKSVEEGRRREGWESAFIKLRGKTHEREKR